jgi:hypothetical protein
VSPFWKRGRGGPEEPPGPGAGAPDEAFPYLTVADAQRLRTLARHAFADAGLEVTVHADHVADADGREFGLANLAAQCHNDDTGPKAWPGLVREHVRRVLAAADRPPTAELPREDILARAYLRLVGTSTVPESAMAWFSYARPVCGDLIELLALDDPEAVTYLRDADVERVGLDDLRAAGLENLLREPYDEHHAFAGPDGAEIHVVLGDSVYTASKLLVLPDLLRRLLGERSYPHGLLVAVPFRHQLAFHPIADRRLVPATRFLAGLAADGFSDGVGSVSPFLYWWLDGRLTQLSFPDGDGGLAIHARGEFAALVERLVEDGPGG